MQEYCGYCSRIIMDDSGEGCSVQFDVIDNDKVYPFLNNDRDFMDSNNIDENYSHALHAYFEYGVDSTEFEQAKIAHFGNFEDIGYLTLSFKFKFGDVEELLFNFWTIYYDFPLVGEMPNGFFENPYISLDSGLYVICKGIKAPSKEESELLSKFFQYRPIYDMQSKPTSAISKNTTFYSAEVLYVGAALCVLVFAGKTEDFPIAIFDMGFGKIRKKSVIAEAKSNIAIKTRDDLLDLLLELNSDIDVFLSHWHQDHVNMAQYCIGHRDAYKKFLEHVTWHVPNTNSTHLNTLRYYSNKVIVLDDKKKFGKIPERVKLNECFTRGKVNCNKNPHPHHHGIFVEIKLKSGKLLLLAGDCTYGGMLINNKNPGTYDYLQMCHHGGNYSLSPIEKNELDIPNSSGSCGEAYSSADGVTHHHPNQTIVQEHTKKGWTCYCTKDLAPSYLAYLLI